MNPRRFGRHALGTEETAIRDPTEPAAGSQVVSFSGVRRGTFHPRRWMHGDENAAAFRPWRCSTQAPPQKKLDTTSPRRPSSTLGVLVICARARICCMEFSWPASKKPGSYRFLLPQVGNSNRRILRLSVRLWCGRPACRPVPQPFGQPGRPHHNRPQTRRRADLLALG